jgi:MFS family permease
VPHHPPKLYSPRFLMILGLQFIFGLGFSSFLLLPKYLTEVHVADATAIGRIMVAGPLAVYPLVVFATAGLAPGWLFPLGVALGLAQGTLYPVVNALLFESAEPESRGALMTYFSGCFNLGIVLATVGLGALAGSIGYRPVFVVASALTLTAVPALALAKPRPVMPSVTPVSAQSSERSL